MKFVTFTATAFALDPNSELYASVDSDEVNAYRVVQVNGDSLELSGMTGVLYPTRLFREISQKEFAEAHGIALPEAPIADVIEANSVKAPVSLKVTAEVPSKFSHHGDLTEPAQRILASAGYCLVECELVDADVEADSMPRVSGVLYNLVKGSTEAFARYKTVLREYGLFKSDDVDRTLTAADLEDPDGYCEDYVNTFVEVEGLYVNGVVFDTKSKVVRIGGFELSANSFYQYMVATQLLYRDNPDHLIILSVGYDELELNFRYSDSRVVDALFNNAKALASLA